LICKEQQEEKSIKMKIKLCLATFFCGFAVFGQVSQNAESKEANSFEGEVTALNVDGPDGTAIDSIIFLDHELAARFDSLWLSERQEIAERFSEMFDEVQQAGDDNSALSAPQEFNIDTLKIRLDELNNRTPFNITYNPALERVIRSFLFQRRGMMERMLAAGDFYFPMFEEVLDKYNLPLEMKYLAIVESALNPKAKSRVGATGLWQFMYTTGKMYGLEVNSYVDERSDPLLATEAACRYLERLYQIFGDWDLVLAAYNSGPGNVNKAIRRSGGYKNYWNIRENLPRETAGYVPAFQAVMYVLEYASEYGLKKEAAQWQLFETDTIHVKNTLTFDQISKFTGIPVAEIQYLNPTYKLDIIPNIQGKKYTLRLPVDAIGVFVNNEEALYAYAAEELSKNEKPLPQLIETSSQIVYRVKSGDYLGKIAQRYGVSVSQIKRWNGLRSDNLRVGQRLNINSGKPAVAGSSSSSSGNSSKRPANAPKEYTVREGDSLWTISRKYPGLTIEDIKKWNGMRNDNLTPGTRLKLCSCSP
jgi:membrane-bound lytic murein transglycosylase D